MGLMPARDRFEPASAGALFSAAIHRRVFAGVIRFTNGVMKRPRQAATRLLCVLISHLHELNLVVVSDLTPVHKYAHPAAPIHPPQFARIGGLALLQFARGGPRKLAPIISANRFFRPVFRGAMENQIEILNGMRRQQKAAVLLILIWAQQFEAAGNQGPAPARGASVYQ